MQTKVSGIERDVFTRMVWKKNKEEKVHKEAPWFYYKTC